MANVVDLTSDQTPTAIFPETLARFCNHRSDVHALDDAVSYGSLRMAKPYCGYRWSRTVIRSPALPSAVLVSSRGSVSPEQRCGQHPEERLRALHERISDDGEMAAQLQTHIDTVVG
jgi:hypothetical protein